MPLPRVAIVGRPNVGKSSLLNLLAREKVSIVDDLPGVTRDRVSAIVSLDAPEGDGPTREIEVIDTGGFGVYVAEGQRFDDAGKDLSHLTEQIEWQIAEAVGSADLVIFAIDAQVGITPRDEEIAKMLREQKFGRERGEKGGQVPVVVLATKVDGPKWEAHGYELAGLGFGDPLMIGSLNNYMRRDLLDRLYELVGDVPSSPEQPADLKLAIVGKRNVGKSTLINALAGAPRVIVSEIAGTTRDAVDVRFELDGKTMVAIDTAGLRRKKSFAGRVEWFALDRLERSIRRADAVLFMIDATERLSHVDNQLAALVLEYGRPVVIVINKWDLVEGTIGRKGKPIGTADYADYLRTKLKGLKFAPLAFMSAKEGTNIHEVIELAGELHQQSKQRVGTGELNRFVERLVSERGPSSKLGAVAKIYYAAQTGVCPPTISLVVNKPDLFSPMYQRFLVNRFREELPFGEVPMRLRIKARSRRAGKARNYDTETSDAALDTDFEHDLKADDTSPTFTDADWAEAEEMTAEDFFED
ncbi:MAG TPA: ribosome biogenesis GTPase Der [Phycisphaerales bacterium]|nr:ribosome biogenesis GTPase Der [Phycisphaerales bacterium]